VVSSDQDEVAKINDSVSEVRNFDAFGLGFLVSLVILLSMMALARCLKG